MVIIYNMFVFMGWSFLALLFIWSANGIYQLEKRNYDDNRI